MVVATLSQLAVPRMLRIMIDAVSQGVVASNVLESWQKIPLALQTQALPRILETLNLPKGI